MPSFKSFESTRMLSFLCQILGSVLLVAIEAFAKSSKVPKFYD